MPSRLVRFIALIFFCCALFTVTAVATDVTIPSTVVSSKEVRDPLTTEHLARCVTIAEREMNTPVESRPQIVVLHISAAEARKFGMTKSSMLSNRGAAGPTLFYEIWIVGTNGVVDLVRGVETIFEMHFGLHYKQDQRAKIMDHILQQMGAAGTIDVNSLRDEYTGGSGR